MGNIETERLRVGSLTVARSLHEFVEREALPGSGVESQTFWRGLDEVVSEMGPCNRNLLARREKLQRQIDEYHRKNPGRPDPVDYQIFLKKIGYLVDEPAEFTISTSNVDQEISTLAGPQLVVPLLNARFATNAVNARWGSLYDALYGTDVIAESAGLTRGKTYNPARGAEVVARGRAFLDEMVPLARGSHAEATEYAVDNHGLVITVEDEEVRLAAPEQFRGYQGDKAEPDAILLIHHGLHIELLVDHSDPIGAQDSAGIKDIVLEAALTSIMDLEDSVAAVDVDDKVRGYRNWLHLMQGTLAEDVTKEGKTFTRTMNPDRSYTGPSNESLTLAGRAVMFIRQVGPLMMTDAVLDENGNEIPEGILDALITGLCSLQDLRKTGNLVNSRTGSMYVVKPKMHGPEEVAFTSELFTKVESVLGMEPLTIKMGIMDEERRTSLNLKACIAAAADRVAFINTGFLDRTGDEIHTSMHAGPTVRKAEMKGETWIEAYENSNVDIGLECGLAGRAQIGKGMWAAPDNLADMLDQKIAHPNAGANCAWVPSPTAATLHAIHYHQVNVHERQRQLAGTRRTSIDELLTIPLGDPTQWTDDERLAELDNNVQSTLGYVVRWVDAGIGCSKVPDLSGTPLMEDRATCRISSQHITNWLLHSVITKDDVEDSLRRMAQVVDQQNAGDPEYLPMAPDFDGEAFLAARELLLTGQTQPSGYTEPILHRRRSLVKNSLQRTTV